MTYFLQLAMMILAMVLALASHFFEVVKKDEQGHRVMSRRLPVLTAAGYVVLFVIAVSFLGSVFLGLLDKRDSARKESAVQQENRALRDSVESLSKTSSNRFAENLTRLETIRRQEENAVAATAKSVDKLHFLEAELVPSKYISLSILLNGPKMNADQVSRFVAKSLPTHIVFPAAPNDDLQRLACAERARIESFELRILISETPDLEYVIGRKVDKDGCSYTHSLQFVPGGEGGREPPGANKRDWKILKDSAFVLPEGTGHRGSPGKENAAQIILIDSEIPTNLPSGSPLHAGLFGEHPFAELVLSGGGGFSDAVTKVEAEIPKSITVQVESWSTLPSLSHYDKPSFKRSWYLIPFKGFSPYAGLILYDYHPLDAGEGSEYDPRARGVTVTTK